MHMRNFLRPCLIIISLQLALEGMVMAQLTSLPRGGNKRASVSEQIGITDVIIHYSRPGVKKREGHIWNELIPVGYSQLGYGAKNPAPWRAGANENTTIEFTTDVKVEGHDLVAGKYGFFVAYDPNECTLIFSKNSSSWGNFFYDSSEDALRIKVKPVKLEKSIEWLKYEFTDQTAASAIVQLQWEKLMIPFKIDVDVIKTQLASFRKELRGDKALPGNWQPWNQAASYCLANNTNLAEGLLWADTATSKTFGGTRNFEPWQTKAAILDSLGRKAEADEAMKTALSYVDDLQGYTYGYALVNAKRPQEAFEIFKMIYSKYPNTLFTNIGMATGYSALGDYKKALTFALKALPQAKGGNKIEIERNIRDLQNGKDMNN
jgi:tetratricopeptide (TPR) repeat protein